jgi:hypothetical protein
VDLEPTDDFRWPYYTATVFNVLGLATRMEREEHVWLELKQRIADEADVIKITRQDLAAIGARIRENLSEATVREHGGKTKDERLAYIEAVVAGAPEYQEQQRVVFEAERRMADLELAAEKSQKVWGRLDHVLRFMERVLATLSTFTPQSASGAVALRDLVPVWEDVASESAQQALERLAGAEKDYQAAYQSGDEEATRAARVALETAAGAVSGAAPSYEEPPPGFVEESDVPF